MILYVFCYCCNRFWYGNLLDLDLWDVEVGKLYILLKFVILIDYYGKGFINYDEGKCVFLLEVINIIYVNLFLSSLFFIVELVSFEYFYLKGVVLWIILNNSNF